MKIPLAIAAYAAAAVAANFSIYLFGSSAAPVNAFILIGFDLVMRDYLHAHLSRLGMAAVIAASSLLTFLLAPGAKQIAVASGIAFLCAGTVDWLVFRTAKGSWLRRSNLSNTAGAAADSVIFPLIAFGGLFPSIMLLQFVCKTAGGALWALAAAKFIGRDRANALC